MTVNRNPAQTVLNFGQEDDADTSIRQSLLKESGHISRSEQLLDEQYDIALKTRENLVNQRWTIKYMQNKYNNITNRFSSINTLIKKIGIRKRRDTIIVAIVFAICMAIFLYNLF